jgi:hypothetical protein
VNLERKFEGYETGDLICFVQPFGSNLPLMLEIAIRKNGEMAFRSWGWSGRGNQYLHTEETAAIDPERPFTQPFIPTPEQIETVNGLFSGRITFEGLRLSPGASLQRVCPVDVQAEEARVGKNIFLA